MTLVLCEPHVVDGPAANIGAFQHVYHAGFAGIEPCDMDEHRPPPPAGATARLRGRGGVQLVLQPVLPESMDIALVCMPQSTNVEGVRVGVHCRAMGGSTIVSVILWRNHRAVCRRSCLSYMYIGANLVSIM